MSQALPYIHLVNLTYTIAHTNIHFGNLNLSFCQKKTGIVGDNGVGKTTLLRLLAGELQPMQGSVQRIGNIAYVPQSLPQAHPQCLTIAQILGVDAKLKALANIQAGSINAIDYEILADDWGLVATMQTTLAKVGLHDIAPTRLFAELSGGQQTRVLLAKALLSSADFILLDEPTNNLDSDARELLYQFIATSHKGIIVISHDRQLLSHMDEIVELTMLGMQYYGGNYQHFVEQKSLAQAALSRQLIDAKKAIAAAEKTVQQSQEKLQQRKAKGRHEAKAGKVDKLTANSRRGRSEKNQAKLAVQEQRIIGEATTIITEARAKIEIKQEITADLTRTALPTNKLIFAMESVCFTYDKTKQNVIHNFNLTCYGPERIALSGANGGGKSTLVKLLLGQIEPVVGSIKLGVESIYCLDQQVSLLNDNQNLIDNYLTINPLATLIEAYHALAQFMFRNKDAEKLAKHLSGGERVRAGLACVLLSKTPPQLLILDEPTNHLDVRSIECIEMALQSYQGGLLVISHDKVFLENIGVTKIVMV